MELKLLIQDSTMTGIQEPRNKPRDSLRRVPDSGCMLSGNSLTVDVWFRFRDAGSQSVSVELLQDLEPVLKYVSISNLEE